MASLLGRLHIGKAGSKAASPEDSAAAARRAILIPLAAAQFIASYDSSSMNVAISNIVEDLDTTVTGVQAAISLFLLTMAALMIPGSKLTDIWGRKRCFSLGLMIYATGALITALAPSLPFMVLGYSFLEGVGSALMIPPIYILITVLVTDNASRVKAFAVVSAMAGLGAATGPLVGGFLTTAISWRASYVCVFLAICWIYHLSRRIEDPGITGPKPAFDVLGTVLSAGGLVFIVLGLLLAGDYGWLEARKDFKIGGTVLLSQGQVSPVVVFIIIGLSLLLLFGLHILRYERHGKEPLLPSRLFHKSVTNLGLVTQNSQWFIMIGTFFVVSVFLQISKGYSAIETGLVLTAATAGILLSASRMGKMIGRFSQRAIIRLGFVVTLAGTIWLLLFITTDGNIILFLPGLFLTGFGAGSMLTASVNVVQSSVPEDDQGALSGLSRSVSNLGSSMGTALAGAVLISALVSGFSSMTSDSTVLSDSEKAQATSALQTEATTLSDAQVQELLQGQPQDKVDEITRINAEARDRAMAISLVAIMLVGLIGLAAAIFLPPDEKMTATASGPPPSAQ